MRNILPYLAIFLTTSDVLHTLWLIHDNDENLHSNIFVLPKLMSRVEIHVNQILQKLDFCASFTD